MPLTVRATLCEIRDDLHALRKTVAARGQIETIQAIDALIGVAESEAVRAIRRIDLAPDFQRKHFNEYRREKQWTSGR